MVVNIGFIGCGDIAQVHFKALADISNAKMVAFSDIDLGKAKGATQTFGGKAYSNYMQMLENEKLDCVFIAVPPFARGFEPEIVKRGIHIFVEKPVALTMEVAENIRNAIVKAGVLNSVGYVSRYYDVVSVAKNLLEENGPIGMVEGHYILPKWIPQYPTHWWLRKDKSGGQIVEQVTHLFDLARYLIGDVDRVYAELETRLLKDDFQYFDIEDVAVVSLRFKNGAIGAIISTCASQKTNRDVGLRIFTKKMVLEYVHRGTLKIWEDLKISEIRSVVDPYFEEDKAFIEAVASGNEKLIKSTFDDAVKTLQVTLAANESARKKQLIYLK